MANQTADPSSQVWGGRSACGVPTARLADAGTGGRGARQMLAHPWTCATVLPPQLEHWYGSAGLSCVQSRDRRSTICAPRGTASSAANAPIACQAPRSRRTVPFFSVGPRKQSAISSTNRRVPRRINGERRSGGSLRPAVSATALTPNELDCAARRQTVGVGAQTARLETNAQIGGPQAAALTRPSSGCTPMSYHPSRGTGMGQLTQPAFTPWATRRRGDGQNRRSRCLMTARDVSTN